MEINLSLLFIRESPNNQFLCCIIDEASQCTEPESLTPLVFGISKLVLIGDPDQLPATVLSSVGYNKEKKIDALQNQNNLLFYFFHLFSLHKKNGLINPCSIAYMPRDY